MCATRWHAKLINYSATRYPIRLHPIITPNCGCRQSSATAVEDVASPETKHRQSDCTRDCGCTRHPTRSMRLHSSPHQLAHFAGATAVQRQHFPRHLFLLRRVSPCSFSIRLWLFHLVANLQNQFLTFFQNKRVGQEKHLQHPCTIHRFLSNNL